VVYGSIVARQGGCHGMVFYMKSLDLDLRMGYELGTVFGYGLGKTKGGSECQQDEAGSERGAVEA
jgi:hypothetical protein